jgi:anaerobic magnesium-protoporphyrin IX monomethyl ester cyclase
VKICLIRPSTITTATAVGEDAAPPLGLAYVAAALRAKGHDVCLVDALGEGLDRYERVPELPTGLRHGLSDDEVIDRIPADTRLFGFAAMFSLEWPFTRRLIDKIRQRFPSAIIIAGGEHITALSEYSMLDCAAIDYCILGEGEDTVVDLVSAVEEGGDVSSVEGICYRRDGEVVMAKRRNRIRTVQTLQRPAWDLVPIEKYLDSGAMTGVNFGRSMPILASRGCPYQCTFCSSPAMWGTLWRIRPEADVIDEIRDYVHRYNAQNFDFYDLTAIVKREWIKSFSRMLMDEGLNVSWQLPSGTRSEALDAEVTGLLYESGCRYANYAPESGSERTLKRIKKKIKKSSMLASMRAAVRNRLNIKANMIFGFPGETLSDIARNYVFIMQMAVAGINDISVFPFSPYPGSALFTELLEKKQISLSDDYFYSLSQYTDPRYIKSYCEAIPPQRLRMLCLSGMAVFYGVSFALRPWRLLRLVRDVWKMTPQTKLGDALVRIRKKREKLRFARAA